MNAETIARARDGRKTDRGWLVRCPAHDDRTPSLSIWDTDGGEVRFHCFAGCDFDQIRESLRQRGLWTEKGGRLAAHHATGDMSNKREPMPRASERSEAAQAIWQSSLPIGGTLAEPYLASRGLQIPATPCDLRSNAGLRHPSGGIWPVIVGLVTRCYDNVPIGIHRTFLARDGGGKAPVSPQKMMLGPCRGGVVRLAEPSDVLMIGEGIETCLAAMQATGYPAWAALSTSGLRTLELPITLNNVIILADGDEPGETAAQMCAHRWVREGRRVRIARPPKGSDFNDLLLAHRRLECNS